MSQGLMSERRDSNPRPRPWQGRALPAELLSRVLFFVSDGKYKSYLGISNRNSIIYYFISDEKFVIKWEGIRFATA